jgi:GMP synthase (glutamine-hydrolysing)
MLNKNGVIILDFGSQYTQLIARRIRENNVYSEILPPETNAKEVLHKKASAIILSGGPNSVYGNDAPNFDEEILDLSIPILGICYGLQLLVYKDGGIISSSVEGEYGSATIKINKNKGLFSDVDSITEIWMSHGDKIEYITNDWEILATSSNGVIAAIENKAKNWVATQFHPEVSHSKQGDKIISNFLFKIANCKPSWTAGNFIQEKVSKLKEKIGAKKVLVGVSGGVDSTVVAALLHKAIGENSISVLIDHGLLRKSEALNCIEALQKGLGVNIKSYDESELFLSKLKSITDPEKKRKIIGNEFIYSFERISKSFGKVEYLAQGTLYPDIVESGFSKGKKAHVIKSHHNVGGLPEKMDFELIEPLKELFKDEVRKVGLELGLPSSLVNRHPFPGPGLGVRIIGEINESRIKILQEADKIYMDILIEDGLYDDIWQAFAVLIPIKTVGVMGDQRTYENLLGIRAVTSQDGMTADWYRMPSDTLSKISNRIVNNVEGINRVVYDITSKPPGTIEWE